MSDDSNVEGGPYGKPGPLAAMAGEPGAGARKPLTAPGVRAMKAAKVPIVMVTAYDATFARILDDAGVDVLLVGDSLGMVVQGQPDTLGVTLDDVLYHTRAVARGSRFAHVVADMPFLSYQVNADEAVRNAGRLLGEGRAHAVKLEGGRAMAKTVERLVSIGIPVMGHVGLQPQSKHALGGFRVQGRGGAEARSIRDDARALAEAGAYALVLEGISGTLAAEITAAIDVPTIGIGAGVHCDGQVLVCYDLLGLNPDFAPKFVKRYDAGYQRIRGAAEAFAAEVRARRFPGPEHTFGEGPTLARAPASAS